MDEEESQLGWRKIATIIFVVICIIFLVLLFTLSILMPMLKD